MAAINSTDCLYRRIRRPLCILLFACVLASAQEKIPLAAQKNWDLSVWVAGSSGEETTNSFAQSQIFSAGIFGGRVVTDDIGSHWRRGSLEYAFSLAPVFVTANNQNIHGFGFEPVILRWNSGLRTSRMTPYIELAGGGLTTNANLPPGKRTSSFNFTAKGGGGIYLFRGNRQALDIGFGWSHISNANLTDFNPEFNGLQLRLGYHWYK